MSNASLELGGGNWAAKDNGDGTGSLLGYAVGDTSGKYLPREFTFSRGADIAATRVNKDGLIEKYRENLFLQSNQFDTTWIDPNADVTGGQAGRDGTNDAWELSLTGGYGQTAQAVSASGVNTLSFYAKSGTSDFTRPYIAGPNQYAYFDLLNGQTGTQTGVASSIEDAGNGWWRCSFTVEGTITEVRLHVADSINTIGTSTSGTIYIQDAQLERGLVATDYLESDDETGKAGVLDDLPRIDYTSGSAQLLMEPSRTNLISSSEYFSDWTAQDASVTDNATTSPEGLKNAAKLIPDSGTDGNRSIGKNFTGLSGVHTFSVFAKAAGHDYIALRMRNPANSLVMFNLSDGSVENEVSGSNQYVANSAKIEPLGSDWYRCSASFDPSESTTVGQLFVSLSTGIDGTENSDFDGDGTNGVFVYGAQLEAGDFATSYIPNYGTSGGVTRAQDVAIVEHDIATNAWTMFMDVEDFSLISGGDAGSFALVSYGSASVNCLFFFGTCFGYHNTSGSLSYVCGKLGNAGPDFNGKFAVTYDGDNTIKIYVDGSLSTTITDAEPTKSRGIQAFKLQYLSPNSKPRKQINQVLLFSKELSQLEAEALTE